MKDLTNDELIASLDALRLCMQADRRDGRTTDTAAVSAMAKISYELDARRMETHRYESMREVSK